MAILVERLEADFRAIGLISSTPGRGATRPTFSVEWGAARDYVAAAATAAGCRSWVDSFGNLHARPSGLALGRRVWLCGSHLDTVPHGGDYDGVAGVLVGLELLRSAAEEGVVLPLELVVFAEEEGPTFGLGMMGARLWVGDLDVAGVVGLKNSSGENYLEAGRAYGVDSSRFLGERFDRIREGYLGLVEAHIEQGPGMWRRDQRVAVVRSIAGRKQYRVTVLGEANHAGATSMEDRNDALAGACEMVVGLEAAAKELGGECVVTVGRIGAAPNAINVIADKVEFTIDFRAPDDELLRRGDAMIKAVLGGILECRPRLKCQFVQTESQAAAPMNSGLVEALAGLGGGLPVVVSGALHDSAIMARWLPTVMVFVASRDGISHNPAEFSRVEDVAEAARIIERLVRRPLLSEVNGFSREGFVRLAGGFFEHSAWVAERTFGLGPFTSRGQLAEVMSAVVRAASAEEQMGLIRAHPDLVGRLAREGKVTAESAREQAAAGLGGLTAEEVAAFEGYNAAYREKFGFPFIICARKNKKEAILAAFPERLGNSREREIETALGEIDKIAGLRIHDAIGEEVEH